jgi:hypothetical protein
MQSDRHARISDRAYQIWLAEGRVHGKHDEHWKRAEREIAADEANSAAAARPRRGAGSEPTSGKPVRARSKAPTTSDATPASVSKSRAKANSADKPRRAVPRQRQASPKP